LGQVRMMWDVDDDVDVDPLKANKGQRQRAHEGP